MTNRDDVLAQASEVRRLHALVKSLWPGIGHHSDAHDDAARQCDAALEAFHERWDAVVARVREGDSDALDAAVVYLEARPRCYRSGYVAEAMMRAVSRARLSDVQAQRLREVVLAETVGGWTRGHTYVGALAGAVWNADLEADLSRLAAVPGGERAATTASAAERWIASGLR